MIVVELKKVWKLNRHETSFDFGCIREGWASSPEAARQLSILFMKGLDPSKYRVLSYYANPSDFDKPKKAKLLHDVYPPL